MNRPQGSLVQRRVLAIGVEKDVGFDGDHRRPSTASRSLLQSATSTPCSVRPECVFQASLEGSPAVARSASAAASDEREQATQGLAIVHRNISTEWLGGKNDEWGTAPKSKFTARFGMRIPRGGALATGPGGAQNPCFDQFFDSFECLDRVEDYFSTPVCRRIGT